MGPLLGEQDAQDGLSIGVIGVMGGEEVQECREYSDYSGKQRRLSLQSA